MSAVRIATATLAVEVSTNLPDTNPAVIGVAIGLVLLIDVVLLIDLARRPVKHLPKPAWAALILLSFPFGAIIYAAIGRVRRGEEPIQPPPPLGASAVPVPPPTEPSSIAVPPHADEVGVTLDPSTADRGRDLGPTVLTTTALRKTYGEVHAVDGVDLAVPAGAIYGLIGPNGAGKTTLLSMIAGLRKPTSGDIDLEVPRERIAVLADTPLFEPWLTAAEVVDLSRSLVAPHAPTSQVHDALAEVGLVNVADRRVGGFSRGMLQRLGLATCLVGDPEVLVLDEPSAALDPAGRREVLDLIARLAGPRTIILSTHVLVDVQQVCDTVGVLLDGRLVHQGPIHDLLRRTATTYRLQVIPPAEPLTEALSGAPWVRQATEEAPGSFRVDVTNAAEAEEHVVGVLAAAGARLRRFEPATDLETAFFALTNTTTNGQGARP